MQQFFHQLFDYNYYCNKGLIEDGFNLKEFSKKTAQLINHILNAQHIWNRRMLSGLLDFCIWQEHNINSWQDIHYQNQSTSFEIIKNTSDFDEGITTYENS